MARALPWADSSAFDRPRSKRGRRSSSSRPARSTPISWARSMAGTSATSPIPPCGRHPPRRLMKAAARRLGRDWSKRLAGAGYAGPTWPKEFGGAGLHWRYQALYREELARAEAPQHLGVIGLGMAGPTIIAHGRADQKARYLAKILSAEDIWCQGFSEPGSGSDLASVRTRVELVGDRFVVNGQKVWSSYAHIADRCILLGRSTTASEKHEGLTYLIVDMKSPGVEVRPLRQITGEAEFNEIFFTDVAVPKENLLGDVGGGWRVAMTTLSHERGTDRKSVV